METIFSGRLPDTNGLVEPAPNRSDRAGCRVRLSPLIEAIAIFCGIMLYIWVVRRYAPWTWVLLLAAVVLSHVWRRESPVRLGFGFGGLGESFVVLGRWSAAIALAIVVAGILLHSLRLLDGIYLAKRLGLYLLWGLAQQYLLNAYFANRFSEALPYASSKSIAIWTGIVFALAHSPNQFLMAVTLVGGAAAVLAYIRFKSLYALALAHGVIGFLLTYALPENLTHHLRIGPGFFQF